jgi:hypothetical protein
MAEQKKKGFHAFEDRVHELEEEDAKQRESASERQVKDTGSTERGGQRPSEESGRTRK